MLFKERFDLERKEALDILGFEAEVVDFCPLEKPGSIEDYDFSIEE